MTTKLEYKGNAPETTLAAGITSGALSFSVASGGGTGYPDGSAGSFIVCIGAGTGSMEKILCDSRSADTFTVNASGRGYDNTTAVAHTSGDGVTHVAAAQTLTEASAHVGDTTRDDHTQYLKADGSRAGSGTQAFAAATFSSTISVTGTATLGAVSATGHVTFTDGKNIALGTTTGTQIGTASTQKLGFYGATPIVKGAVTGSRGGNAALASLLTYLASLGILTDSSTA